ncbi:hypothetical protein [Pseudoalteromonas sp. GABNS16H]|nr:hypothetical protein [Pseudoalteromonas sp. GABNS16H]MDC9612012.1 hypothetical protein [Pseudoalteromonas sp. GABNS16H]
MFIESTSLMHYSENIYRIAELLNDLSWVARLSMLMKQQNTE